MKELFVFFYSLFYISVTTETGSWSTRKSTNWVSRLLEGNLDGIYIKGSDSVVNNPISPTETSAEPSLQAKQLKLKRARLADDLNDKISHRPGPIELIHKNILPVHTLIG